LAGQLSSLAGTRVFVVEDEALVLMSLEDTLAGLACTVVASALSLDEALAKATEPTFDVAILDVNLGGHSVGPVADLLAKHGIPFIFASGYGAPSLPASYRDRPLLTKPFADVELRAALLKALASARPASP